MSEQKINYEQAKTFLEVLGEVYGCKEFQFQTFDDCKILKRTHLSRKIFGNLDAVFNKLSDLNNQGAGIFICVNKTDGSGERQNKVITDVRSVFADLDDVECEYPLEPSLIVQSKRGEHAYWFTTECELENFKKIQLSISSKLNSDKNVNDLCRVMRLPGFFHKKDPNNPFMVTVSKTTSVKYAFNKIIEAFPSVSAPEAVKKTTKKEVKASNSEIQKYVLSQAPAIEGENGDINTYKVACALVKGFSLTVDEALTYFKLWNEKCAPMWSDEELLQKLKNAQMYGTGDSGYLIKRSSKTQWLKDFLSERDIKMDYHGKIKTGDKSISFEELMRIMKIEYDEKFGSNPKILESILEQYKVDCQKEILKKYQLELAFDVESDAQEVQKFTAALVGNSDANFDLHVVVIKHFLWQVKRKLFAMPVTLQIIVGDDSTSKTAKLAHATISVALRSLTGPIHIFYGNTSSSDGLKPLAEELLEIEKEFDGGSRVKIMAGAPDPNLASIALGHVNDGIKLTADASGWFASINKSMPINTEAEAPAIAFAVACVFSKFFKRYILKKNIPDESWAIDLLNLNINPDSTPNYVAHPINIGQVSLLGAGAIGGAFGYVLTLTNWICRLEIIDSQSYEEPNHETTLLISRKDVLEGPKKAERLADLVNKSNSLFSTSLVEYVNTASELLKAERDIFICAVDIPMLDPLDLLWLFIGLRRFSNPLFTPSSLFFFNLRVSCAR